MNVDEALAGRFEAEREHLRGVAFRMLGSLEDAEDAVQQTWLQGQPDATCGACRT